MSDENEKGFVIIDKRDAREGKHEREDSQGEGASSLGSGSRDSQGDAAFSSGAGKGDYQEKGGGFPEVNFATFVITLSTSALLYLGEIPDPETNKPVVNLPLAKHTIDTLGMLKEKTQGNLTPDESKILDQFLYDLRMKYVARVRAKA